VSGVFLTASVPWLSLFIVGISHCGHEFDSRPVDMVYVMDKFSMGVGIL
jgi:hypothetical protein